MAENDNTPAISEPKTPDAIVDQDTLEAALKAEPVKPEAEAEPSKEEDEAVKPDLSKKGGELIFGKYKTLDDAREAYANIQARATKAEQNLKELKREMEGKSREEIKKLDYDGQMEFLLNKVQELEEFKADFASKLEDEAVNNAVLSDAQAIDSFVSKNPILKETGLDEEFRLIATHPTMQEYSLESIYNVRILPKLEKLMGTKITTKERKLVGSSARPEPDKFKDVSKMSPAEYEKHRKEILAGAGIK